MGRHRFRQTAWPTKEENAKRTELTIARIRALSGQDAKELLEELIQRNEITGICIHAREFVDNVATRTLQAQVAQQVEALNPKLTFADSNNK